MVSPRTVVREREERQRALVHWDGLLHETLAELRDALDRIREMDKQDARPDPGKNSR